MKKNIKLLIVCLYLSSCVSTQNSPPDVTYLDLPTGAVVDRDPAAAASEQIIGHGDAALAQINWYDLFAEINYMNVRKMSASSEETSARMYNSAYYANAGFNQSYTKILGAGNTKQAFHMREKLLNVTPDVLNNLKKWPQLVKFSSLGPDQKALADKIFTSVTDSTSIPAQKLAENNNYFKTTIGAYATDILKDYVIVVVPGFGSHTIKDYTWPEILRQANQNYGRPLMRPETKSADGKSEYQKIEDFYGKAKNVGFDVVHPMGYELGFSMGSDVESGKNLADWLVRLKKIPAYSNKKFILIGYSKGTPISLNTFVNQPEISDSIAAIFTMAGVAQGSIPANSFVKTAYEQSGVKSKKELISYLAQKLEASQASLKQVEAVGKNLLIANGANEQFLNKTEDVAKMLLARGGIGLNPEDKQSVADNRKAIEGIIDMSNYESVQWSLKNLNNQKFKKPISIFDISMITNVKDFVRPNPLSTSLTAPLIVPQFNADNTIQYSKFSKDDVFLYMTSITGFEEAPGGLFDTQVAWPDTKMLALDARPLTHSLAPSQIALMKARLTAEGVALPAGFEKMSRRALLSQIASSREGMSNLNIINLADYRGSHWDPAFEQVYKPSLSDTQNYYRHQFPRRALQASVIEMLAAYKQLGGL